MKKVMYMAVMACLISGSAFAACMIGTSFCADDSNVSVGGLGHDGNGVNIPVLSSTSIAGLTPRAKGQLVLCNSCTGNSATAGGVVICYSTGTAIGSFVIDQSTAPVCK